MSDIRRARADVGDSVMIEGRIIAAREEINQLAQQQAHILEEMLKCINRYKRYQKSTYGVDVDGLQKEKKEALLKLRLLIENLKQDFSEDNQREFFNFLADQENGFPVFSKKNSILSGVSESQKLLSPIKEQLTVMLNEVTAKMLVAEGALHELEQMHRLEKYLEIKKQIEYFCRVIQDRFNQQFDHYVPPLLPPDSIMTAEQQRSALGARSRILLALFNLRRDEALGAFLNADVEFRDGFSHLPVSLRDVFSMEFCKSLDIMSDMMTYHAGDEPGYFPLVITGQNAVKKHCKKMIAFWLNLEKLSNWLKDLEARIIHLEIDCHCLGDSALEEDAIRFCVSHKDFFEAVHNRLAAGQAFIEGYRKYDPDSEKTMAELDACFVDFLEKMPEQEHAFLQLAGRLPRPGVFTPARRKVARVKSVKSQSIGVDSVAAEKAMRNIEALISEYRRKNLDNPGVGNLFVSAIKTREKSDVVNSLIHDIGSMKKDKKSSVEIIQYILHAMDRNEKILSAHRNILCQFFLPQKHADGYKLIENVKLEAQRAGLIPVEEKSRGFALRMSEN